ncbi:MAG: hypothetical protein KKF50_05440 [Nanoarchaeota archaeon]|nr:hypothetical protein [Nanoarchaeota archaeon]
MIIKTMIIAVAIRCAIMNVPANVSSHPIPKTIPPQSHNRHWRIINAIANTKQRMQMTKHTTMTTAQTLTMNMTIFVIH